MNPTQKPIELLKRIIASSSNKEDLILDPFNGSGTTGIVANILNRKYIGIEKDSMH
ncbi:MAG: site-specific DNA-methyltransferase [Nanoarchaeota archaeon]|nr:site-specific DNA-methyltransferase [Nanoarchaeota archaeon]